VRLARFLRSGDLTEVYVPDEATEAMRDLERARDDAKKAERVARHQLGKFLLRHERCYPGKTSWTGRHLEWIRAQHFAHEAHQRVPEDYLRTMGDLGERVARLTKSIVELVETWSLRPLVKALQALRGISVVPATVLAAELGSLTRFESAPKLMGYLGLVPSGHSSGEGRQQGRITRAGNGHARRILVVAAWAYRFRPRQSRDIALRRLTARGKNKNKTTAAIARELAG
jgi:transposase